MSDAVTNSQFYMWRTLFAMVHVDDVVSEEEVRFMAEAFEDVPFSREQHRVLMDDAKNPQDIIEMFKGISDVQDQAVFFKIARDLVYIDGEYGPEEQEAMLKLKELHLQHGDVDDLIGRVTLELEDDADSEARIAEDTSLKRAVYSFRSAFLKQRFDKDKK